jgi:hypothetical protein
MRNMMVHLAAYGLLCGSAYAGDSRSSVPPADDANSDATLSLTGGDSGRVAPGIGYTWGHGWLHYGKRSHGFSIHGISTVDADATAFMAVGEVYHLQKLVDFSGKYVAAGAGLTIAPRGTAIYFTNEHGVIIKLLRIDVGLQFNLSVDGAPVKLKTQRTVLRAPRRGIGVVSDDVTVRLSVKRSVGRLY